MSLTSEIRDSKSEIQKFLAETKPHKEPLLVDLGGHFPEEFQEVIPSPLLTTAEKGQVGMAVDYLVRIMMVRRLPNTKNGFLRSMKAKEGYDYLSRRRYSDALEAEVAYKNDMMILKNYWDGKADEDAIIPVALDFGRLESLTRFMCCEESTLNQRVFDAPGKNVVSTLKDYISSIKKCFIPFLKDDDIVTYDPDFRKASALIHGADCDLLINGKLIDIKTNDFRKSQYRISLQIWGYYLLNLVDEIMENKVKKPTQSINSFFIYFVRLGALIGYSRNEDERKGDIAFAKTFLEILNKRNQMICSATPS